MKTAVALIVHYVAPVVISGEHARFVQPCGEQHEIVGQPLFFRVGKVFRMF